MDFKRVDPLPRYGMVFGELRRTLLAERDQLRRDLARLDAQLADLARRRQAVKDDLDERHRRLFPDPDHRRGRQPDPDGRPQLPPLEHETVKLWGRRLRSVCLALLRASGALPLPALHALLHRHGYEIEGDNQVKVLADAMAYEVDQGRARRPKRGVYEVADAAPPRAGAHGNPPLLPLVA